MSLQQEPASEPLHISVRYLFLMECAPGGHANPSWGHLNVVLGAILSFLEPFCGHLSPEIDKVSERLTFEYPHEGPCVVSAGITRRGSNEGGRGAVR